MKANRLKKRRSKYLEEVKSIAIEYMGECLSKEYIDNKTKLQFLCKNNHTFEIARKNLVSNTWCYECAENEYQSIGRKYTIEFINKKAARKNVKCISDRYIGNKDLLEWKCLKCSSVFKMSKNYFDRDFAECKMCRFGVDTFGQGPSINKNIQQRILKRVKKLNGKILSEYNGNRDKILFRCENNHEFEIRYNNFYAGQWCVRCSGTNNISEEICRSYFEQLFSSKFPSVRPDWLKNSNNNLLELDGFCEELSLAFEHQGEQHYKNTFPGQTNVHKIQYHDRIKVKACKERGICLIVIPALFRKTYVCNLKSFIKEECLKLDFVLPQGFDEISIDLKQAYSRSKFDEYKDIAISKGGRCLSEIYFGAANKKLLWECKNGHTWEQFPYVIKKGHWCPKCWCMK